MTMELMGYVKGHIKTCENVSSRSVYLMLLLYSWLSVPGFGETLLFGNNEVDHLHVALHDLNMTERDMGFDKEYR